jgi:hypothetical protein
MKNKIAGKRDIESAFKLLCKSMPKSSYLTLEMEVKRLGFFHKAEEVEVTYVAYCDASVPNLVYGDSAKEAVEKLIERTKYDTTT